MVSCLIRVSLKRCEGLGLFVCGVGVCAALADVRVAAQLSWCHWLRRPSFLRCVFLPALSRINWL